MPRAGIPKRILVIEAQPRWTPAMAAVLGARGYEVERARGTAEAMAALIASPLVAVVVDDDLEPPGALELCAAAKRAEGRPLVCLLAADAGSPAFRVKAAASVDELVGKPLLTSELITRIRLDLRRRDLPDEPPRPGRRRMIEDGGDLEILDALEALAGTAATGVVAVQAPNGRRGRIWVSRGVVVDAAVGPLRGPPAFRRLARWRRATVSAAAPTRRPEVMCITSLTLPAAFFQGRAHWVQVAGPLPLDDLLLVDYRVLGQVAGHLPTRADRIARLFDGRRRVVDVIDDAAVGDAEACEMVAGLLDAGILVEAGEMASAGPAGLPGPTFTIAVQDAETPVGHAPLQRLPTPTARPVVKLPPGGTPLGLPVIALPPDLLVAPENSAPPPAPAAPFARATPRFGAQVPPEVDREHARLSGELASTSPSTGPGRSRSGDEWEAVAGELRLDAEVDWDAASPAPAPQPPIIPSALGDVAPALPSAAPPSGPPEQPGASADTLPALDSLPALDTLAPPPGDPAPPAPTALDDATTPQAAAAPSSAPPSSISGDDEPPRAASLTEPTAAPASPADLESIEAPSDGEPGFANDRLAELPAPAGGRALDSGGKDRAEAQGEIQASHAEHGAEDGTAAEPRVVLDGPLASAPGAAQSGSDPDHSGAGPAGARPKRLTDTLVGWAASAPPRAEIERNFAFRRRSGLRSAQLRGSGADADPAADGSASEVAAPGHAGPERETSPVENDLPRSPTDPAGAALFERPVDTAARDRLPDPPPSLRSASPMDWPGEPPPSRSPRRALAMASLGAVLGIGGALAVIGRAAPPPSAPTHIDDGTTVAVVSEPRPRPAPPPAAPRPEAAPAAPPAPSAADDPTRHPPRSVAADPPPAADPAPTAVPPGAAPPPAADPPSPAAESVPAAAAPADPDAAAAACRRAYQRERYSRIVKACGLALSLAETGEGPAAGQAAEMMAMLAHAELDRGNFDRARSWALKALGLDSRLAQAYAYLGFVEDQAGRRDEALAAYRSYLQLAPRGRYAEDIRAIVDGR